MISLKLLLLMSVSITITSSYQQPKTLVSNRNILHRKKRYLTFPKGANFVITMSAVKALQQTQPKGWMMLGECDVPFALPSDTRIFKHKKGAHKRHKRDILVQIETAFSQNGLNGNACVKRIICEAQRYMIPRGESLVADLLNAIFSTSDVDLGEKYMDPCHDTSFSECDMPFFNIILNTFLNPA